MTSSDKEKQSKQTEQHTEASVRHENDVARVRVAVELAIDKDLVAVHFEESRNHLNVRKTLANKVNRNIT
jgi:hypothetical protein